MPKMLIPFIALLGLSFTAGCFNPDVPGIDRDDQLQSDDDDGDDNDDDDDSNDGDDDSNDGDDDSNDGDAEEPQAPQPPEEPEPVTACAAYCGTELTCDDYYGSQDECLAACDETAAGAACEAEFDDMNWCLSALDCAAFDEFWIGFAALTEGTDPGPFPCLNELADWVVCESEA